ncbi:MAG: RNA methyltransferase [bacterium]|nr:RNA methyltransferase [bacterium]
MRSRWGRWHGYMEELEEAMRVAGQHLAEVERLVALDYERATWRGAKRDGADAEVVRRALDIPFLRDLVRIAHRLESLDDLDNAGFIGRDWKQGENRLEQPSQMRAPKPPDTPATIDPAQKPPARIVAAERALQDRTRSLVVVLDHLINSRNVSAILRSLEALGLQEVHIIESSGKPEIERTLSTRAERWLDVVWHRDSVQVFGELRKRGYRILAAHQAEDSHPVDGVPLAGPTALVFGGEQKGVSPETLALADGLFHLPNSGFTAYINVSVATALATYALDRRMREAALREPLSEQDMRTLRPAWYAMLARGDGKKEAEYLAWADRPPSFEGK